METLKEELETQTSVAEAPAAKSEIEEMTEAEFVRRLDTDAKFASDYLNGKLDIEKSEPEVKAEAPAEPSPKMETPKVEPEAKTPVSEPKKEEPKKDDDGKFIVEFEDGSKLAYKSKNEALKAIREKENYIRRSKETIEELRQREAGYKAEIEKLKTAPSQPKAEPEAPKTKAEVKQEAKAEEILDPFDPDYLKKLGEKLEAQEKEIKRLQSERESDRAEWEKEKSDRKAQEEKRAETEARQRVVRERYSEATAFVNRHPEFKMAKPIEVMDSEYQSFLTDLGEIVGTDGSLAQNLAAMNVYLNDSSEDGKKLKAEAERLGVRPPEEIDKFFKILGLLDQKNRLFKHDPVSGKSIPFSLEETHRYLATQSGEEAPQAPPAVPAQKSESPIPVAPRAQAIAAAAKQAEKVATDLPVGKGGQPLSIGEMTEAQISNLLDTPKEVLKNDPIKLEQVNSILKALGQKPLRIDGV